MSIYKVARDNFVRSTSCFMRRICIALLSCLTNEVAAGEVLLHKGWECGIATWATLFIDISFTSYDDWAVAPVVGIRQVP
jgi:hypothetical protein